MANPSPQPTRDPTSVRHRRLKRFLLLGGTVVVLGGVGYRVVNHWLRSQLPGFVEAQVTPILNRPLELGTVQRLSLTQIELDGLYLPPSQGNENSLRVSRIQIQYNLPALVTGQLPLTVTLSNPTLIAQQADDGSWLTLDLNLPDATEDELPVEIPLTLIFEGGNVQLTPQDHPQDRPETIELGFEGNVDLTQSFDNAYYDLAVALPEGTVQVRGNSRLNSLETRANARLQEVSLAQFLPLLPREFGDRLDLTGGRLNANLNLEVPPLLTPQGDITWSLPDIRGTLSLNEFAATIAGLNQPLIAEADLRFQGDRLQLDGLTAQTGSLQLQGRGSISESAGYNLAFSTPNLVLETLPNLIDDPLLAPLNQLGLSGVLEGQAQLLGDLNSPQLTVNLSNSTPLIIQQTGISELRANLSANLNRVTLNGLRLSPTVGGSLVGRGQAEISQFTAPLLAELPDNFPHRPRISGVPSSNLNLDLRVNLPSDALLAPYVNLPNTVRLGQLLANLDLSGTLANPQASLTWTTPDGFAAEVGTVSSEGNASFRNQRLSLDRAEIRAGGGQISVTGNADLTDQTWFADVVSTPVDMSPFLPLPAQLTQLTAQLSGRLDDLSLTGIDGTADLGVRLADGQARVQGDLGRGELTLQATASGLSARGLNLELPLAVTLDRGRVQVRSSLERLMAAAMIGDFGGIGLEAEGRLAIAEGVGTVMAQVVDGRIETDFTAANIALSPYLTDVPASIGLINAEGTASLTVANLLTVLERGDLTQLDPRVTSQTQLALNQGSATVLAEVAGGQWQLSSEAGVPVNDALVQELIGDRIFTSPRFPATLLAQADLSGSLMSLLQLGAVPIPVTVDRLTANIDGDILRGRGNVVLTNLRQRPDLQANLDLEANYDSQRLPLTLLLADVAVGENLKSPSLVNVAGNVAFSGQFQGRNLISNPFGDGNLNLMGGVRLENFGVNEVRFDPLMQGRVAIRSGERVALDLRGQEIGGDRIALALDACRGSQVCLAPYLPRMLEIRNQTDSQIPILALGERRGDRFELDLANFDLSLLNILPGEPFGIYEPIAGRVSGEIITNLFNLETQGRLAVANPGLGYLRAEAIAAQFAYTGQQAVIRDAYVQVQDSRVVLNAATELDLLALVQGRIPLIAWQQAPVQGQLTIEEGAVSDLLTTVAWYDIEDLLRRGIASPSVNPEDLTVTGVGIPQRSLPEQFALFNRISGRVAERAKTMAEPQPPQVLDIQGTYNAQVDLGGTLGNPNLTAQLTAEDWIWYTQPPSPLVSELATPRPRLTLDQLRLVARFQDNVLTVEEATIQAEGAEASLRGRLSATAAEGGFEVVNVPLSLLDRFVTLPVDVAGEARVEGQFGGTLQQPTVAGEVAIATPVLNNRPLDSFLGNFSYDNRRFEFATLAPSWSQLQVSVPFPFTELTPETAIAQAQVALDTPALALIEAVTEGQLRWLGGEGTVNLNAQLDMMALTSGNLQQILQSFLADGAIAFDQAQFEATALPEAPTQLDGVIRFNQDEINVDELVAQVAEGEFRLAGVLPFLIANPELERPLTLTVANGQIQLAGLYDGQLDGAIRLGGTALTPVISGGIELSQGRVLVPTRDLGGAGLTAVTSPTSPPGTTSPPIIPVLDEFRVTLGERLNIVNPLPSFNVRVQGDVVLNGVVDGDLANLRPQGVISVERGQLDLLSNLFFITPGRPQTVEFIATEGLLNPRLDLQMSTLISEERRNPIADRDRNSNEVPDTTILPLRQSRQLLVNITVEAMAEDVLAAIFADEREATVTVQGFERNQALLDTVQLSSIPNRSENELVSLLGGQVLTTIDEIAQLRGTEFFEYALLRFVLEPELTGILVDVDRVANQAGEAIGLDRLSVFPIGQIEAIYELNERSLLGLTYDYGLSGFLLQGGQTESGTPGFESIELRYELRF